MEKNVRVLNILARTLILQLMFHPKSELTLQEIANICDMQVLEMLLFIENEFSLEHDKAVELIITKLSPHPLIDSFEVMKIFQKMRRF